MLPSCRLRRPLTGARIETANVVTSCDDAVGRPLTGARIETVSRPRLAPWIVVAPSQGRGLKLNQEVICMGKKMSPPHRGAD